MGALNRDVYMTKNNFDNYTNDVNWYLNTMYGKSLEMYMKIYGKNNPTGTFEIDMMKMKQSLEYIDDYLYYYYQRLDLEDFLSMFRNLCDNLNAIMVFSPKERGAYGRYVSLEKTLYINPELKESGQLSSDERTRLYVCHELGHIQNLKWKRNIMSTLGEFNCPNKYRNLIYDGLCLFDEAITQDRAENIAYHFSSKIRPQMYMISTKLFGGMSFKTNFDYYGEFQGPTVSFAKTLRDIGKFDDADQVMAEFSRRALRDDFAYNIFNEYSADGKINCLYSMLIWLGIIKNASYAAFGQADREYIAKSYTALVEYCQLVDEMYNYNNHVVR